MRTLHHQSQFDWSMNEIHGYSLYHSHIMYNIFGQNVTRGIIYAQLGTWNANCIIGANPWDAIPGKLSMSWDAQLGHKQSLKLKLVANRLCPNRFRRHSNIRWWPNMQINYRFDCALSTCMLLAVTALSEQTSRYFQLPLSPIQLHTRTIG